MADITYVSESEPLVGRANWGAIWAGTFTFIAIFAVFGMLGMAIFANVATPNPGFSAWMIILTIIAMFVGGRATGRFAGVGNSHITHGIAMFGLSATGALLLIVSVGSSAGVQAAGIGHLIGAIAAWGWPLWVALFLGWLGAIGGAASAHRNIGQVVSHQQVSHA